MQQDSEAIGGNEVHVSHVVRLHENGMAYRRFRLSAKTFEYLNLLVRIIFSGPTDKGYLPICHLLNGAVNLSRLFENNGGREDIYMDSQGNHIQKPNYDEFEMPLEMARESGGAKDPQEKRMKKKLRIKLRMEDLNFMQPVNI